MAFDYETCTKDTLDEHASTLGLTLDLSKPIKALIAQCKEAEKPPKQAEAEEFSPPSRFLFNPKNGRVFEFTEALFEYGLIPCDENGKRAVR